MSTVRVATLLLSVVLLGCGGSDNPDWLLEANGPPATMDAELTGEFVVHPPCALVLTDGHSDGISVVFPAGTRVDMDADPPQIRLENGQTLVSGDVVTIGGGAVSIGADGSLGPGDSYGHIRVPLPCAPDGRVWLMR